MFYVIPGTIVELSEKELAAAASATITTRILIIFIKEVYAIAWNFFSKVKLNQKKRF